jgi:hypothetical protein
VPYARRQFTYSTLTFNSLAFAGQSDFQDAVLDPQECTKVFDLGNVKDAFPESKAGVHGFG